MTSCPELVYSRINSRCLLPQLVDRLVLPIATGKNPSTHGQAACIKANLHHVSKCILYVKNDLVVTCLSLDYHMPCSSSVDYSSCHRTKMISLRESYVRYSPAISTLIASLLDHSCLLHPTHLWLVTSCLLSHTHIHTHSHTHTSINVFFNMHTLAQLLMSPWFEERTQAQQGQLIFILDTITSQFLQLPQQPASLLPVSTHWYWCA